MPTQITTLIRTRNKAHLSTVYSPLCLGIHTILTLRMNVPFSKFYVERFRAHPHHDYPSCSCRPSWHIGLSHFKTTAHNNEHITTTSINYSTHHTTRTPLPLNLRPTPYYRCYPKLAPSLGPIRRIVSKLGRSLVALTDRYLSCRLYSRCLRSRHCHPIATRVSNQRHDTTTICRSY